MQCGGVCLFFPLWIVDATTPLLPLGSNPCRHLHVERSSVLSPPSNRCLVYLEQPAMNVRLFLVTF